MQNILEKGEIHIYQKGGDLFIIDLNGDKMNITDMKQAFLKEIKYLFQKIQQHQMREQKVSDILQQVHRLNQSALNDIPQYYHNISHNKQHQEEDDELDVEEEEDDDGDNYQQNVNQCLWDTFERQGRIFETYFSGEKIKAHQRQYLKKILLQKELYYEEFFQKGGVQETNEENEPVQMKSANYSELIQNVFDLILSLSLSDQDCEQNLSIPIEVIEDKKQDTINIDQLNVVDIQFLPHLNLINNTSPWISKNSYSNLLKQAQREGFNLKVKELNIELVSTNISNEQCREDYQLCSECIQVIESDPIDMTKRFKKQVIDTKYILTDSINLNLVWNYGQIPQIIFHSPLKHLEIRGENIGVMPLFENNSYIQSIHLKQRTYYISDQIEFYLKYYTNNVGLVIFDACDHRIEKIYSQRIVDTDKLFDSSIQFFFDAEIINFLKRKQGQKLSNLITYHLNQKYRQMLISLTFFKQFENIFCFNPNFIFSDLFFD